MYSSINYQNCKTETASSFAKRWGLKKSQVRRAFHPSEWHHCNFTFTYGNSARAYFYGYNREELATILRQARAGKFSDLGHHHSHTSGGKQGQEKYFLEIWKKGRKIRLENEATLRLPFRVRYVR